MREHLGFLKVCSIVVKAGAWIILLTGLAGSIPVVLNKVPGSSPRLGVSVLLFYVFSFFFLYLIAKIADLLMNIFNEIKKEQVK